MCKQVLFLTQKKRAHETAPTFHPEFGRFMLEATPGKPWSIGCRDLLDVEPNMKLRSVIFRHLVPWLIYKFKTQDRKRPHARR